MIGIVSVAANDPAMRKVLQVWIKFQMSDVNRLLAMRRAVFSPAICGMFAFYLAQLRGESIAVTRYN